MWFDVKFLYLWRKRLLTLTLGVSTEKSVHRCRVLCNWGHRGFTCYVVFFRNFWWNQFDIIKHLMLFISVDGVRVLRNVHLNRIILTWLRTNSLKEIGLLKVIPAQFWILRREKLLWNSFIRMFFMQCHYDQDYFVTRMWPDRCLACSLFHSCRIIELSGDSGCIIDKYLNSHILNLLAPRS